MFKKKDTYMLIESKFFKNVYIYVQIHEVICQEVTEICGYVKNKTC